MADSAFATLAPLEPLMDKCVHCGFCLPACPSYLLLGRETDSPRGRIYAMRAGVEGRVGMTPPSSNTSTPASGAWRARPPAHPVCDTRRSSSRRAPRSRQVFAEAPASDGSGVCCSAPCRILAPSAARVANGTGCATSAQPLVSAAASRTAAAAVGPRAGCRTAGSLMRDVPEHTAAAGERRARVGLVTGCVQRAFFGKVNEATVRVLAAEGCQVEAPRSQGCCGALALHAGEAEQARTFARELIATFERTDVDFIAVNAAGCGSALKEYGHLLRDDPAWAARARRVRAQGSRRQRAARAARSSRVPPAIPSRRGWPITMPATSPMRRACGRSRARCWVTFRD